MSGESSIPYRGYTTTSDKWETDYEVRDFEPTEFREDFIEIAIEYCGICSSDVHTLSGGWGEVKEPLVSGHEIAGKITRVGPKVTEFKVGDYGIVGAQLDSCGKCKPCNDDNENYCPEAIDTYNAPEKDGKLTQGGYSTAIRAPEKFVFHLPEGLAPEDAAPMACGGLTVWSPMMRYGVKKGTKMALVGLGGLGHFAVLFGAALGAEVTVFSHQADKKEDALKMGAKEFVLTDGDDWMKPYAVNFDFILSTIDNSKAIPLTDLVTMLYVNGRLHIAAMPDDELPPFKSQALAGNGATLGVNHIGNKKEAEAMFKFAAEKGIKAWKEILPMKDVAKGIRGVHENNVRYRYVLKQDLL
ncbi:hypothetical protein JCM11251_001991 [Rhodosporidiobolus azoricus]